LAATASQFHDLSEMLGPSAPGGGEDIVEDADPHHGVTVKVTAEASRVTCFWDVLTDKVGNPLPNLEGPVAGAAASLSV
jgi:hypothetical protein